MAADISGMRPETAADLARLDQVLAELAMVTLRHNLRGRVGDMDPDVLARAGVPPLPPDVVLMEPEPTSPPPRPRRRARTALSDLPLPPGVLSHMFLTPEDIRRLRLDPGAS